MGRKITQVRKELLADGEFRREFVALEGFSIAAQSMESRTKANLTHEQGARRMGTTQSVVAASICSPACAAYRCTPPRKALIFLPRRKTPRFQSGNRFVSIQSLRMDTG